MNLIKMSEQLNQRSGEPQTHAFIRKLASKKFEELNWPSKKMELWRYSPTHKLQGDYLPQINAISEDKKDVTTNKNPLDFNAIQATLRASLKDFIDPRFETIIIHQGQIILSEDSKNGLISPHFQIISLKKALEQGLIDSSSFKTEENKLEALNLSYFEDGYFLKINEQAKLKKPLHLIYLHSSDSSSNPLFQTRFVVSCAKGSEATLIETHMVTSSLESNAHGVSGSSWNNSTSLIQIEDEAHLNFIQWSETPASHQDTHRTHITLQNKSKLHYLQGIFCEGWKRNELNIRTEGSDAEMIIHSFGFSQKDGVIDQPSRIEFSNSANQCQQIFKNLLTDQSRAIFNGFIKIHPAGQKTDCSQLHQSLLLSSTAEVDTKPELEIYADDVKATHGATVGSLNPDELFYFQSRGISEEKVRSMLCLGFLMELCDELTVKSVPNYLKSRIKEFWMKDFQ